MVNLDKVNNKEVNIYVETAYNMMQKCLDKARERGDENVYKELYGIILEGFESERLPDDKFLRNLNDKIKKLRDQLHPEREMVIYNRNLVMLATIAGVDNYEVLREKYKRLLLMPVLYSPRPYRFVNFIRVPQNGILKQNRYKWEYSDGRTALTGQVTAVTEFTMPGDRHALWVKVNYEDNGLLHEAFFAGYAGQTIIPVNRENELLAFFKKLLALGVKAPAA